MLAGLHASDIGLMYSKTLRKLSLRETVLGPEVRNLNGQPAGKRRPLPLRTECGVAKVFCKDVLVSYQLVSHRSFPLITSV